MCWDMWAWLIYRWGSLFRGLGGKHSQRPGTGSSSLLGEAWTRCWEMRELLCLLRNFGEVTSLLWAQLDHSNSKPACNRSFFRPCGFPTPTTKSSTPGLRCQILSALAVWPGASDFCLWSSVPSFKNSDNSICHSHTDRPGRGFLTC